MDSKKDAPLKAREWDGIMLRRGYFEPSSGVLVLEGLSDSAKQRGEFEKVVAAFVEDEGKFARVFDRAPRFDFPEHPLEPMLVRLRRVIPAYSELDGLTLEGASHDVENRLVLRFSFVGRRVAKAADGTLLTLLQEDKRYEVRVRKENLDARPPQDEEAPPSAVRLLLVDQQPASVTLSERYVRESIETLRKAYVDVRDDGSCRGEDLPKMDAAQVREYRLNLVARAMPKLDAALLHNPRDSTAWYLRSICFLATNDSILVRRDLRRMVRIERSIQDGRSRRVERLELLEHLQGDFRRQLARWRKQVEGEIDQGTPGPLRLSDLP
jgi:hypothetical protein